MRTKYFLILLIAVILISACGGLNEKQKKSAEDAITALKKLDAGTDVGINQIEYSRMLIDAQALVKQASETLPDGELKQEINLTMESFMDAKRLWMLEEDNIFVEYEFPQFISQEGVALQKKYNLPIEENAFNKEIKYIRKKAGLAVIWKSAEEHLNRASKLSN